MLLIKHGRVLDPAAERDGICDVLIEDGIIKKVAENIEAPGARVIDAAGCFVMPGLVDLHVHLRDPGLTYKEDIETGAKAAARGGFTTILAMPNTKPVIDTPDRVAYVKNKARQTAPIHVLQVGAVTMGQEGKELADIEGMVREGSPAISEDGKSVMDAGLYRKAMEIAAGLDIPVLAHCEDKNMVAGGVVNEDEKAGELGLKGICNAVEDVIAARDIVLAKETGARLHLCHCSTRDSVEMIRQAKKAGLKVSGEVCPHHFTLTSQDIPGNDSNYKMNPPLRTEADRQEIIRGLSDGTIDIIATDHAPHSREEKKRSITAAPSGIIGLETALALGITELVEKGHLTLVQLMEKMSLNPARLYRLADPVIEAGAAADLVIFDPEEAWTVTEEELRSKSKNTPFLGQELFGRVKYTICGGKVVYKD